MAAPARPTPTEGGNCRSTEAVTIASAALEYVHNLAMFNMRHTARWGAVQSCFQLGKDSFHTKAGTATCWPAFCRHHNGVIGNPIPDMEREPQRGQDVQSDWNFRLGAFGCEPPMCNHVHTFAL